MVDLQTDSAGLLAFSLSLLLCGSRAPGTRLSPPLLGCIPRWREAGSALPLLAYWISGSTTVGAGNKKCSVQWKQLSQAKAEGFILYTAANYPAAAPLMMPSQTPRVSLSDLTFCRTHSLRGSSHTPILLFSKHTCLFYLGTLVLPLSTVWIPSAPRSPKEDSSLLSSPPENPSRPPRHCQPLQPPKATLLFKLFFLLPHKKRGNLWELELSLLCWFITLSICLPLPAA